MFCSFSGFSLRCLRRLNKKHFTRSEMAGLFFCLASAEGCRAFALLCCNVATHKRLQRVLHRKCNYTANTAKQRTGLYKGITCDLTRSTAHDTRPTQAAIIPPAPRWSVSQRRNTPSAYQIPDDHAGTLCSPSQPHYYNKVYKGAAMQHTADHANPAGWIAGKCYTRRTC